MGREREEVGSGERKLGRERNRATSFKKEGPDGTGMS